MKLQEKLSAMKQESMAKLPPEKVAIMSQATKDLIQSGIAEKAIKVGEKLPDFLLPDEKGDLVSSQDLLARGPLAVSFYRGVW